MPARQPILVNGLGERGKQGQRGQGPRSRWQTLSPLPRWYCPGVQAIGDLAHLRAKFGHLGDTTGHYRQPGRRRPQSWSHPPWPTCRRSDPNAVQAGKVVGNKNGQRKWPGPAGRSSPGRPPCRE